MTNDIFAEKLKELDTKRKEVWNKIRNLERRNQELYREREALVKEYIILSEDRPLEEVVLSLAQVSKIWAIKNVRNSTGWTIRKSKDFVDRLVEKDREV